MLTVFRARLVIVCIFAGFGWLAFQPMSVTQSDSAVLTVSFLDVGQGDAVLIQTPDGYELLVDGGASGQVLRQLSAQRSFFDRTIDVVLATHPDTDHVAGLVDVLKRYSVASIIQTQTVHDTPAAEAFLQAVTDEQATVVFAQRGDSIQLGASTTINILSPYGDTENWQSNTASIVIQVVYGDIEFMLTGDAPSGIEEYLVAYFGDSLESEVLKLGHHGSQTSTSQLFLDVVQPQFAVVSAGADNRYGHPHDEVIERVENQGATILSTAQSGTIVFETDGQHVWQKRD